MCICVYAEKHSDRERGEREFTLETSLAPMSMTKLRQNPCRTSIEKNPDKVLVLFFETKEILWVKRSACYHYADNFARSVQNLFPFCLLLVVEIKFCE